MDTHVVYKVTKIEKDARGKDVSSVYETTDYHKAVSRYNTLKSQGHNVSFEDFEKRAA